VRQRDRPRESCFGWETPRRLNASVALPHERDARAYIQNLGSRALCQIRNPQPAILPSGFHQPCAHGILNHVINLYANTFLAPQDSIEPFPLPNLPITTQQAIDLMRRSTLDALHDLRGDAIEAVTFVPRSENQMNMIRHYHSSVQIEARSISPCARFKNYRAGIWRQDPALVGRVCQEDCFIVALIVGRWRRYS
jgi:hypothetical protein